MGCASMASRRRKSTPPISTSGCSFSRISAIGPCYQTAVDVLVALHRLALADTPPVTPEIIHTIPPYDLDALMIEVELLLDWYMPYRGANVTAAARDKFLALWRAALAPVVEAPKTWVLRDFHSPNLLWL